MNPRSIGVARSGGAGGRKQRSIARYTVLVTGKITTGVTTTVASPPASSAFQGTAGQVATIAATKKTQKATSVANRLMV